MQNEKLVAQDDSKLTYQELSEESPMKEQMPAFLSQAHLSTWYQDNPWDILTYGKKYGGTVPLGGQIDPTQPPGYKPNNTYAEFSKQNSIINKYPNIDNNKTTKIVRENFENDNKIKWN
jgi:hypothetical protein